MNIVIIGGGCAGFEAALAARRQNPDCTIQLFSEESVRPYRRPALPRLLTETVPDLQFYLKDEAFFAEQKIELVLNRKAVEIDRDAHLVRFADGSSADYDKLLLATGSNPFRPPVEGSGLEGVLCCRSLIDVKRIAAAIEGGAKRIVVIGGGLLGLELTDNLLKAGMTVTVAEGCPTILPKQLDSEGAALLAQSIAAQPGLSAHYGACVQALLGKERVTEVALADGAVVPADLVILSVGVRSNAALAERAGLPVERGLVVDEHLQSADPDIYGAGDCASVAGFCPGLWPVARDQGRAAGINMAGGAAAFQSGNYPARLVAFGTKLFSIGDNGAGTTGAIQVADRIYRRLSFDAQERLCGVILIGEIGDAARLQQALEQKMTRTELQNNNLLI